MNKLRKGTVRERAWRVMRALRSFTLRRLCMITGGQRYNLGRYVRTLAACGYLKQEGREMGHNRWRLIKDTGPIPPVMKTVHYIYDPNTKETLRGDRDGTNDPCN